MTKKLQGVGAYVIAKRIQEGERKTASGLLLAGSGTPVVDRAVIVSLDECVYKECIDRESEALRMLNGEVGTTIVYLKQNAIDLDVDEGMIAIHVTAVVAFEYEEEPIAPGSQAPATT